jgi:hypothetical protein
VVSGKTVRPSQPDPRVRAATGGLAFTGGSRIVPLVLLALALVFSGALLVVTGWRREATATRNR